MPYCLKQIYYSISKLKIIYICIYIYKHPLKSIIYFKQEQCFASNGWNFCSPIVQQKGWQSRLTTAVDKCFIRPSDRSSREQKFESLETAQFEALTISLQTIYIEDSFVNRNSLVISRSVDLRLWHHGSWLLSLKFRGKNFQ